MALEDTVAKYTIQIVQEGTSAPAVQEFDNLRKAAQDAAGGTKTATAGLSEFRNTSLLARDGMRGLNEAMILTAGTTSPELTRSVFLARDALLATRAAAILTGSSLGTIIPIVGAIGVAIGAGVYAWHEWADAGAEAAKQTKELEEALEKLPGYLEKINTLREAGRLGPGGAGQFADYLTGQKKLYRNSQGELTQSPTEQVEVPTFYGPAPGVQVQTGTEMQSRNLPQASMKEIEDWVTEQLSGRGGLADTQTAAIAKLREEEAKVHEASLEDIEKEKAAVHDRYQKERDEITATMQLAGSELTPKEKQAGLAALTQSNSNEAGDIQKINTKEDEAVQKAYLDYLRTVDEMVKQIDADEARSASEDAADQKAYEAYLREVDLTWKAINSADMKDNQGAMKLATEAASGLSKAMMDVAEGSKSAQQAFGQFAVSFLQEMAEMIEKALVLTLIEEMFGLGGGQSFGSLFGSNLKMADGGVRFAASGLAGVGEVSSPTYFPRFNVLAGERGTEMLTVLARPTFRSVGGMDAVVGNAGSNRLAITNADALAQRGGMGGVIHIKIDHTPETQARIIEQSVQGAVVRVTKDMSSATRLRDATRKATTT